MAWAHKLPSGRWRGQYRDRKTGKVHSVLGTFAYKQDARDAADDEYRSKRRGTWTDPALAKVRFDDWAEHCLTIALRRRDSTKARDESYLKVHLLPAFGDYALGAIEPIHVQRFVGELSASRAPATVAIAYRMLARIMAAAVESGYIERSPCRGVELPRVEKTEMRFLTAAELERLAETSLFATAPSCSLRAMWGFVGARWLASSAST